MSQIDSNKILKMMGIIALVFAVVGVATHFHKKNSVTLQDYAVQNPEQAYSQADDQTDGQADDGNAPEDKDRPQNIPASDTQSDNSEEGHMEDASGPASSLTGALLNGGADGRAMLEQRVSYLASDMKAPSKDFYYEPLSENLRRYITGVSYPADAEEEGANAPAVAYGDLRYVHILHYDFDGEPVEGELICNAAIAQDLLEIFYELYRNEYQIEKVLLIDAYNGDDTASMEDNNTSCFNYRVVEGSSSLSKHALGLALDINPFYNPYITYHSDGTQKVSPTSAGKYADRTVSFPYKIDENDLCYKLFTEHGFIWGGNWNSVKDYQHFQKTPEAG